MRHCWVCLLLLSSDSGEVLGGVLALQVVCALCGPHSTIIPEAGRLFAPDKSKQNGASNTKDTKHMCNDAVNTCFLSV